MAQQLESACFDALFFADTQGIFEVYRGSWHPSVRHAVQVPAIDPVLVLPAIAAATRWLGLAVTYSTTYNHPYQCARLFSSLDHLTQGRIAWNVVTSFLSSACDNGLGEFLPHNQRYDRADEYLEVVRGLWERSWEDDAVLQDASADVFADSQKVHEIGHHGRYFSVRGPHQCEPSLQRTPVIYQAGASERGMEFAARHAEVVFMSLASPAEAREFIEGLRRRTQKYGRPADAIKVLQGGVILLGRDRDEVREKARLVGELVSAEGDFAKWSGWSGFDLAGYPDSTLVKEIPAEASRSVLGILQRANPQRAWTVADLRAFVAFGRKPRRQNGLVGTAAEVADQMQRWLEAGIDGFNLLPSPPTLGVNDICELLVPELQQRGLFRRAYEAERPTLRERYFGPGRRYFR